MPVSSEPSGYSESVPVFPFLFLTGAFLLLQLLQLFLCRWLVLFKQVWKVECHPITLQTEHSQAQKHIRVGMFRTELTNYITICEKVFSFIFKMLL